jgi:hypothetical protein
MNLTQNVGTLFCFPHVIELGDSYISFTLLLAEERRLSKKVGTDLNDSERGLLFVVILVALPM